MVKPMVFHKFHKFPKLSLAAQLHRYQVSPEFWRMTRPQRPLLRPRDDVLGASGAEKWWTLRNVCQEVSNLYPFFISIKQSGPSSLFIRRTTWNKSWYGDAPVSRYGSLGTLGGHCTTNWRAELRGLVGGFGKLGSDRQWDSGSMLSCRCFTGYKITHYINGDLTQNNIWMHVTDLTSV